jgi:hypothetical protein
MTAVNLTKPVTLVPEQAAITASTFEVVYVEENYGWDYDPSQPGGGDSISNRQPGQPQSVTARVILSNDPYHERRITVWQGEAYVAVRGTWTDTDLNSQIAAILNAEV